MKLSVKLLSLLLLVLSFTFISCDKDDDDDDNTTTYRADLSGSQEVPSNPSTATGTFNATYNNTTGVLNYNLTYTGLTPTGYHVHLGAVGVNGPIVIDLGAVVASPLSGTVTLTAPDVTNLNNGQFYVNVHTAAYPGGEIRGQLVVVP